jgi:hypothetical protein
MGKSQLDGGNQDVIGGSAGGFIVNAACRIG